VVNDDVAAGRMAAQHLLDKAYQHYAFCGYDAVFSQQRWSGFASTIAAALGEEHAPAQCAANGQSIDDWLERLPRPLGLMAAGDERGAGAMAACQRLGLRVPEDVAVVVVNDDDLYAELTVPSLSGVAQQTDRIGYLAAEHLTRLVRGAKVPRLTLVPPGPFMARQSSGGVPTADKLVVHAVRFMEQNLARGVNVEKLTRTLGVPRRSLQLRFMAALGRSPRQELARLKIERARGLLATTSLSLKEIAALCGFATPVRMSQSFQHDTGQPPMAFRHAFQGQ
jgi:LacI family transcriptional regulator